MFNKGNSKGFIACIPIGGHSAPNSTLGDKALWKKVQKIAKKKRASLPINNPTPRFKPFCTARVWSPKYVPSLITSLNHKDIEYRTEIREVKKNIYAEWNKCIVITPVVVMQNKLIAVVIGHGEGDTKWKGWAWKLLLIL